VLLVGLISGAVIAKQSWRSVCFELARTVKTNQKHSQKSDGRTETGRRVSVWTKQEPEADRRFYGILLRLGKVLIILLFSLLVYRLY